MACELPGAKRDGFPGTSEKFRTLDPYPFVNNHLQALAKNEGILLVNPSI